MTDAELASATMRAVRFHSYGEPADVLRLDDVTIPGPGPGPIRVSGPSVINPVQPGLIADLGQAHDFET